MPVYILCYPDDPLCAGKPASQRLGAPAAEARAPAHQGPSAGHRQFSGQQCGGADPDNVTIVDAKGTVLNSPDFGELGRVADRFEMKWRYEQQLENSIVAMLERILVSAT